MMKPKDKKAWCDALRSGDYKQTAGMLRDHKGYCCLGVACEVFGLKALRHGRGGKYDIFTYETEQYGLPKKLEERLGFDKSKFSWSTLANMNDEGASFKEIADYIEEYL